jgi:hypothetical protein
MPAGFEIGVQGLTVSPDDADNPNNHQVPHSEAGIKVSCSVINVGDEPGPATIGFLADDNFVTQVTSGDIAPGAEDGPWGVSLGRYPPGQHVFVAYVSPSSGDATKDNVSNTVTLE